MYSLTEFGNRTLESARDALQLYFKPLSVLANREAAAKLSEAVSVVRFSPAELPETEHLRIELKEWRARLSEHEQRSDHMFEIHAALEWSDFTSKEVEQLTISSEEEYRNLLEQWYAPNARHIWPLRPLYYQTQLSWWFKFAAWLLVAVDAAVLSFLLPMLFEIGFLASFGVGVFVTLISSVVTTAVVSGVLLERFESQPRRASQILTPRIAAIAAGILVLVSLLVLVRTGKMPSAAAEYVLSALVVLIATLVAFLQSGSNLFGWSGELAKRCNELVDIKNELWTFRHYVSELAQKNEQRTKQSLDEPRRRILLQDEEV